MDAQTTESAPMAENRSSFCPTSKPPPHDNIANVVIIDDDDYDRAALERMVRISQTPRCNVTTFSNLQDALLSRHLHDADLLLIDDRLSGGKCAEDSLETLRTISIDCPAIIVSGVARRHRDSAVIRLGAVQLAHKDDLTPITMQRLLAYGLNAHDLWQTAEAN